MRIHHLLRVILFAWAACAGATLSQRAWGESPPNVLLVMTDDQGWGDLGRHGNEDVDTPVLDALHDASVRFERFFVSPVCAPTRAALLTGRYPVRTGVTGVTQRYEVMRADEVTLAEVFRANGYATGCFGKWHNGEQYPNHPLGQGFDEFFGFCGGHWNNYFDAKLQHGVEPVTTQGYITDVLTNAALEFIDAHRAAPFFCYVPFNAPHSPWQVPDRYFDKYAARGLPDTTACAYGMVENLDENIGRLLDRLDERGLRDRTIVIFLTDNGPNTDRYNGDMRGRKGNVHEGGVRVPCFVAWQGHLEPHTVPQIAAHVDVLPTLVELCGLKMPVAKPLDGRSLVPLLTGATANEWPDRQIVTCLPTTGGRGQGAIRGALRTQQYRFARERGADMLFDMQADPSQRSDIAATMPDVLQRLRAAFDEWLEAAGPQPPPRTPIPVGYAASPQVELPAVEALFEGEPRFHNGQGYAHDWITGWTRTADRIWWELEVVTPGAYDVKLSYACPAVDVGSTVECRAVGDSGGSPTADHITCEIAEAFDTGRIARPERGEADEPRWMRDFHALDVGRLRLPRGRVRLELQASQIPGGSVCELDALRLRMVDASAN